MKSLLFITSFSLVACGSVVIDDASGGSGGGGGSGAAQPSTTSSSPGCKSHTDCGNDQLCLFQTGECAASCMIDSCDPCGAGFICDDCASSACPDCLDCRAACIPQAGDLCDDDDPCDDGFVCLFAEGRCAPQCNNGACADPNLVCSECATSACCGCKNCSEACVFPDR